MNLLEMLLESKTKYEFMEKIDKETQEMRRETWKGYFRLVEGLISYRLLSIDGNTVTLKYDASQSETGRVAQEYIVDSFKAVSKNQNTYFKNFRSDKGNCTFSFDVEDGDLEVIESIFRERNAIDPEFENLNVHNTGLKTSERQLPNSSFVGAKRNDTKGTQRTRATSSNIPGNTLGVETKGSSPFKPWFPNSSKITGNPVKHTQSVAGGSNGARNTTDARLNGTVTTNELGKQSEDVYITSKNKPFKPVIRWFGEETGEKKNK